MTMLMIMRFSLEEAWKYAMKCMCLFINLGRETSEVCSSQSIIPNTKNIGVISSPIKLPLNSKEKSQAYPVKSKMRLIYYTNFMKKKLSTDSLFAINLAMKVFKILCRRVSFYGIQAAWSKSGRFAEAMRRQIFSPNRYIFRNSNGKIKIN